MFEHERRLGKTLHSSGGGGIKLCRGDVGSFLQCFWEHCLTNTLTEWKEQSELNTCIFEMKTIITKAYPETSGFKFKSYEWKNPKRATIRMKAMGQFVHVVLFTMPCIQDGSNFMRSTKLLVQWSPALSIHKMLQTSW